VLLSSWPRSIDDLRREDVVPRTPRLHALFTADLAVGQLLQRLLGMPQPPSLLYIGEAGASHEQTRAATRGILRSRLLAQHFGGNAAALTVRLTFASLHVDEIGLQPCIGSSGGVRLLSEPEASLSASVTAVYALQVCGIPVLTGNSP